LISISGRGRCNHKKKHAIVLRMRIYLDEMILDSVCKIFNLFVTELIFFPVFELNFTNYSRILPDFLRQKFNVTGSRKV